MPEGDTVYRLARRLDGQLAGHTVVDGELRVPRFATAALAGASILGHDTHGKHLLTRFADGRTLHTHLKMTGSWSVTGPGKRLPPRVWPDVRVRMGLTDGRTVHGIALPVVELFATTDEARVLAYLGPDPLRDDWDAAVARANLVAAPERPLAAALLDQRVIAGLGNLWVNELCFLRGHSPWTPVGEVAVEPLVALAARALRQSAFGPGPMQVTTGNVRRGEQHWVSGRARLPCRRCGTPIRVAAEVAGDPERRRTWWCPYCQPGPGPDRP